VRLEVDVFNSHTMRSALPAVIEGRDNFSRPRIVRQSRLA
jgi:hypothetical protein